MANLGALRLVHCMDSSSRLMALGLRTGDHADSFFTSLWPPMGVRCTGARFDCRQGRKQK